MSEYVHIDVALIKKVTNKALLAKIGDKEIWLPLSQIEDADSYEEGDKDLTLSITEWIAEQKELL